MSRVVVTGASGGLGLALVAALAAEGRHVVAVGRRAPADPRLTASGVEYVRADLTDAGVADRICEGAETVHHAAALSSPWGRLSDFRAANVDATRILVAAAERAGALRFVHVSSPSIFAALEDRIGMDDEAAPAEPLNHYARTKLEAERLVLAHVGDMATTAIRPRAIVGPDDSVVLPRLAAIAAKGAFPSIRGGDALIELTDVRDVVSAMIAAERSIYAVAGKGMNVSGGIAHRVGDVAQALSEALGVDVVHRPVPLRLATTLAAANEHLHAVLPILGEPTLTRYAVSTLGFSQTFGEQRIRSLCGWAPRHDALATMLDVARRRSGR